MEKHSHEDEQQSGKVGPADQRAVVPRGWFLKNYHLLSPLNQQSQPSQPLRNQSAKTSLLACCRRPHCRVCSPLSSLLLAGKMPAFKGRGNGARSPKRCFIASKEVGRNVAFFWEQDFVLRHDSFWRSESWRGAKG